VIHLYAIAEPGPAVPLPEVRDGELCGIYAREGDREPTPEALLRHERIVESLAARRTLLPVRFGTALEDEDELRALLESRAGEFAAALELVRGRVELGVRARYRIARQDPRPESGRAFVAQKLARRRAAQDVADSLHAELAGRASEAVARVLGDPEPQFAGAYLVERSGVDGFRAQVDELRARRPSLDVVCTGPWPPYSFVAGNGRG
jgi:hypothetical protein